MKVLVCEDDMIAQKVIEVALEKQNAQVISVSDGRKALQFLKDNTVDLIITDIHIPYFNDDIIMMGVFFFCSSRTSHRISSPLK